MSAFDFTRQALLALHALKERHCHKLVECGSILNINIIQNINYSDTRYLIFRIDSHKIYILVLCGKFVLYE